MRQLFQLRQCPPLLLLCFVTSLPLFAQRDGCQNPGIFEYLNGKEGDKLVLKTDITGLKARKSERSYQHAILRTASGRKWDIAVRTCGQYRLKKAATPPLKLKFWQNDLQAQGLDTFENVKIILPFYNDNTGEELLIREYLAYQMFALIDENAVCARLVPLELRDAGLGIGKKQRSYALLLEDETETAYRLGSIATERPGIPMDSLEQYQAALTVLFQYMIGNTDWSFRLVRNVRLFEPEGGGPILSMPFDFDFSGLVNAPYATPAPETGLKTVRDRLLMDDGIDPRALEMAATTLLECKSDILAVCRTPLLSQAASDDMVAYLEQFFSALETGNGLLAFQRK